MNCQLSRLMFIEVNYLIMKVNRANQNLLWPNHKYWINGTYKDTSTYRLGGLTLFLDNIPPAQMS